LIDNSTNDTNSLRKENIDQVHVLTVVVGEMFHAFGTVAHVDAVAQQAFGAIRHLADDAGSAPVVVLRAIIYRLRNQI